MQQDGMRGLPAHFPADFKAIHACPIFTAREGDGQEDCEQFLTFRLGMLGDKCPLLGTLVRAVRLGRPIVIPEAESGHVGGWDVDGCGHGFGSWERGRGKGRGGLVSGGMGFHVTQTPLCRVAEGLKSVVWGWRMRHANHLPAIPRPRVRTAQS